MTLLSNGEPVEVIEITEDNFLGCFHLCEDFEWAFGMRGFIVPPNLSHSQRIAGIGDWLVKWRDKTYSVYEDGKLPLMVN